MSRKIVILLFLTSALASCSAMKNLVSPGSWLPKNSLRQIDLIAEADANSTSATRINIVFLLADASAQSLPDSSREWFRNRRFYVGSLGSDALIVDLQLPPARREMNVSLPRGARKAVAVVLFADYLDADGQIRQELGGYKKVTVTLQNESIQVQGTK